MSVAYIGEQGGGRDMREETERENTPDPQRTAKQNLTQLKIRGGSEKNEGEWTGEVENGTRKHFLAVR